MAGLLGDMNGFLDDPMTQLGAGLLGGQSPFFGVNVASAYQQMLAQRQEALKRQMMQQQMESAGLDLQEKKQKMSDEDTLRKLMQGQVPAPQSIPQMPASQNVADGSQSQMLPGGKGLSVGAPASPAKSSLFDQFSMKASQLEQLGSPTALAMAKQYRDLAEKYRPEVKETKTLVDQSGQRVTVNIYKDGTQSIVPFAPDKEKLSFQDLGGVVQGLDPLTGQPVGQGQRKSVTPGEVLSANVNMRGQNMTDTRDRIGIAYNTGFDAPKFGFQNPNVPGVTPGMSPATANQVAGAFGKKRAETVEQAQVDLPGAIAQTQQTVKLVKDLVNHPGFSGTVGAKGPSGMFAAAGYGIPGTDAQDFKVRLDQLKGQAFLQAYQTLKGGGSISNAEDAKATTAMNRMQTSQSEKEFKAAASEFTEVLQAGLARAQQKAAGNISSGWSIRPIQ